MTAKIVGGKKAAKPCEIVSFMHCKRCLEEYMADKAIRSTMAPRDYARISVGWTNLGIQVWCVRHDMEIVHIDFLGQKVSYAKKS